MKLMVQAVALIAIILSARSTQARAQAPTFEVASIRPNKSGPAAPTNAGMQPNGINFVNLPLRAIIQFAFGVNQPSKLAAIPDWAVTERFDISARAAGTVSADERRLMMQAMLADRFKLVTHREKREVSVFIITPVRSDGKPGPNLIESKGCVQQAAVARGEAQADAKTPICGMKGGGNGRVIFVGIPMQTFTSAIGVLLGRTVIDKTGLTGTYDIDFTFTPEQQIVGRSDAPTPVADSSGPSIYTALREQLGLRLESQKDQEEILVIDHIERPSEN